MPSIEHKDLTEEEKEKFDLKLIDEKLKLYTSVVELESEELKEKWKEITNPRDIEVNVRVTIAFLSLIIWKKDVDVVQINIENRYKEQGIPIQLEDRLVNEDVVPGYGEQDFTKNTPYEYLIKKAPLQKVEHVVRAILATGSVKSLLDMSDNEACLLIERRTWTKGRVASTAKLYHPGSRYELSGLFKPLVDI